MTLFYFILVGVISGVIAGMGMGGGTLLIPLLTIFLSFPQKSAQGINLLVFIPMSIVALIIHIKNKLVDFKVGIPIICSGIIFSVLGSYLASKISNTFLQKIFAVFLLVVGISQVIRTILKIKNKDIDDNNNNLKLKIYIK